MTIIDVTVSQDLKKLLSTNKDMVEGVLADARLEIAKTILKNIQSGISSEGGAPRNTGAFSQSHTIQHESRVTYILSSKRASNGTPLWKYIVGGHRVLTTERSRRWWFWHLKNELGGNYTRKTQGPRGYVPPDDYVQRAVDAARNKKLTIRLTKK